MKRLVLGEPLGPVPGVDLQRPRQVSGSAEEFLVEVVAPPTESLRDGNAWGDGVRECGQRDAAASTADPRPDPNLPQQPGYNKRLRRLGATIGWLVGALARDTSLWSDDVWVVDSTPVECGRSRETARRSELAGWAEYGYCASHSRYFWGLRLHLLCTVHGLPVGFALTGAKADERQTLLGILDEDPDLTRGRAGQTIIGDRHYFGRDFETTLTAAGLVLLRPARKGETERPGARLFKPLRQVIESINDTLKGQLNLEHHGGRTLPASSSASYSASSP